jgi:hypothetical protein
VFHTHRRALSTAVAIALTLATATAPGALAQPTDGHQVVVSGPPTWPSSPKPITRSHAVAGAPDSGLDWSSAAIGAATVGGAFALAFATLAGLRHRRVDA